MNNNKISGIGVSLKHSHFREVLDGKPEVDWFEVHSENFFDQNSYDFEILQEISNHYPISAHSIGLSLGSSDGINKEHLKKLKSLIDAIKPSLVSDHLSWSGNKGKYVPDLLPVPLTQESLDALIENIKFVQDYLGRKILVENPSSYIVFEEDNFTEWDFLNQLSEKSECGLLLDLNNIYVSANNHGYKVEDYLDNVNFDKVGEIHLAGHAVKEIDNQQYLIDNHGAEIYPALEVIISSVKDKIKNIPILIEWDNNVPEFEVLMKEREKVRKLLSS